MILGKIIKIAASRCHILKLKCTKLDFGWGSAPDPAAHLQTPEYKSLPNAINEFFVSVSDLDPVNSDILFTLADDYSSDYVIEVDQVEKRLMNINVYKASGPDFIPNWILRDFAPYIAQPLTAVFNASLREGTVPEIWKSVVPAPKVHPPKLISSDLRPISLLPVLAKVLESFCGRLAQRPSGTYI